MGFVTDDPFPGPDRLIGQSWIDHGYRVSPSFDEVEPCPICGAANQVCTNATHLAGMAEQGMAEMEDET